jgi:hypothetical protein
VWLLLVSVTQRNINSAVIQNTKDILALSMDIKMVTQDYLELRGKIAEKKIVLETRPCIVAPKGFNVVETDNVAWPDNRLKSYM